jgi:hypothetical protein
MKTKQNKRADMDGKQVESIKLIVTERSMNWKGKSDHGNGNIKSDRHSAVMMSWN